MTNLSLQEKIWKYKIYFGFGIFLKMEIIEEHIEEYSNNHYIKWHCGDFCG